MNTVVEHRPPVNTSEAGPFKLLVRRGQLIVVPVCSGCGEPIENFLEANIVGTDEAAHAYHHRCDEGGGHLWVALRNVFKTDQRTQWEKTTGKCEPRM